MVWLLIVAVAGVLYPYLIYPVLLAVVCRFWAKPVKRTSDTSPRVAILLSVYNEEGRILDKIANFHSLDYAADRLELWIGTDGSTDATADIVRGLNDPRIHLVSRPERSGKTTVLNELARRAKADILVFTDVNAFFRPDAVQKLASAMQDPSVGLVSGRTVIREGSGNVQVEGAYYRLESWLKAREGSCGWLAGADGAIYALRADLYSQLPPELINDLVHPCQVVARGFQARLEPLAISEESAGEDAGREFNRQTRITAQSGYLLATQFGPLLSNGRWGMLWVLLSHKWSRWIAAVWIVLGAIAIAAISPPLGIICAVLVLILAAGWKTGARWANLPMYFLLMHFAYLRGLWHALAGKRYVTWKPRAA